MHSPAIFIGAAIAAIAIVLWVVLRRRATARILSSGHEHRTSLETPSAIELKETELVQVETRPKRSSLPPPLPESTSAGKLSAVQHDREVARLRKGLSGTRQSFVARLRSALGGRPSLDTGLVEQLEEILIGADVGASTTQTLLQELRDTFKTQIDADQALAWLKQRALALLTQNQRPFRTEQQPAVIFMIGVNGVGKTTTIGKLASYFTSRGKRVLLVAGDTYRAAAVSQLKAWGDRVNCEVAHGADRADPSAVIFDAVQRGIAEKVDYIIVDTAGRLHTKTPLMEELKKVGRSIDKALGRPADHVLLVLDCTTGQNALQQVRMFSEALPLDGIVLTKVDGSAKGGIVLAVSAQFNLPVRFIGVGERVEDLRPFYAEAFVDALFDDNPADNVLQGEPAALS